MKIPNFFTSNELVKQTGEEIYSCLKPTPSEDSFHKWLLQHELDISEYCSGEQTNIKVKYIKSIRAEKVKNEDKLVYYFIYQLPHESYETYRFIDESQYSKLRIKMICNWGYKYR